MPFIGHPPESFATDNSWLVAESRVARDDGRFPACSSTARSGRFHRSSSRECEARPNISSHTLPLARADRFDPCQCTTDSCHRASHSVCRQMRPHTDADPGDDRLLAGVPREPPPTPLGNRARCMRRGSLIPASLARRPGPQTFAKRRTREGEAERA